MPLKPAVDDAICRGKLSGTLNLAVSILQVHALGGLGYDINSYGLKP
jgi:hypothetical protein